MAAFGSVPPDCPTLLFDSLGRRCLNHSCYIRHKAPCVCLFLSVAANGFSKARVGQEEDKGKERLEGDQTEQMCSNDGVMTEWAGLELRPAGCLSV